MAWIDQKAFALYETEVAKPITAVASVDIFDTLLLRGAKPEPHRFLDMAKWQLRVLRESGHRVDIDARALMHVRLEAAHAVYRHCRPVCGVREATYADIAATMLYLLGIEAAPRTIDRLLEVELAYEAMVLRLNPVLLRILERARAAGRQVIAISDMYLPGAQLQRLIERHIRPGLVDRVYSSADFGYGKSSVLLYKAVLSDLGLPAEALAHCGDNDHSDVRQARAAGIRAVHVPRHRVWRRLTDLWATAFQRLHGIGL